MNNNNNSYKYLLNNYSVNNFAIGIVTFYIGKKNKDKLAFKN
jgi:hypothetical protein